MQTFIFLHPGCSIAGLWESFLDEVEEYHFFFRPFFSWKASFGKGRLRKLTMSDMELRPAILIQMSIHTTNRKGETGKRTEEKERVNRNFWDIRQAMHMRQLTTVMAFPLCFPTTSLICFLTRSIQFPTKYLHGRKRRLTMLSEYYYESRKAQPRNGVNHAVGVVDALSNN